MVVGRMERPVNLEDHSEFLSQDRCEHPVVTHGYVWLDKIQVWTDWEQGMPKPPRENPTLRASVLRAALSAVRATTEVSTHQEPRFKKEGRSITFSRMAEVPNEWAVVYGQIGTVPQLKKNCGVSGCGGGDVPLIIVAEQKNVHRLSEDGTMLPQQ